MANGIIPNRPSDLNTLVRGFREERLAKERYAQEVARAEQEKRDQTFSDLQDVDPGTAWFEYDEQIRADTDAFRLWVSDQSQADVDPDSANFRKEYDARKRSLFYNVRKTNEIKARLQKQLDIIENDPARKDRIQYYRGVVNNWIRNEDGTLKDLDQIDLREIENISKDVSEAGFDVRENVKLKMEDFLSGDFENGENLRWEKTKYTEDGKEIYIETGTGFGMEYDDITGKPVPTHIPDAVFSDWLQDEDLNRWLNGEILRSGGSLTDPDLFKRKKELLQVEMNPLLYLRQTGPAGQPRVVGKETTKRFTDQEEETILSEISQAVTTSQDREDVKMILGAIRAGARFQGQAVVDVGIVPAGQKIPDKLAKVDLKQKQFEVKDGKRIEVKDEHGNPVFADVIHNEAKDHDRLVLMIRPTATGEPVPTEIDLDSPYAHFQITELINSLGRNQRDAVMQHWQKRKTDNAANIEATRNYLLKMFPKAE